jgi:quinol monooxygenase YgiN
MAKLTIVANIKTKANKVDLVKAELLKLIDFTRAEEGCINYDLHQDNENPTHFMFYENWESRELWQTHMESQHLKDYMAATDGAVDEFTVNEMGQMQHPVYGITGILKCSNKSMRHNFRPSIGDTTPRSVRTD